MTPLDIILDAIIDSNAGLSADGCSALCRSIEARLRQGGYRFAAAHDLQIAPGVSDAAIGRAYAALDKDLAATSYRDLREIIGRLIDVIGRQAKWIADLQAGTYVNCVYCGHRYGPGETTPVTMADALKAHVVQCPEHPMRALADASADALRALKDCWDFDDGPAAADAVNRLAAVLASLGRTP